MKVLAAIFFLLISSACNGQDMKEIIKGSWILDSTQVVSSEKDFMDHMKDGDDGRGDVYTFKDNGILFIGATAISNEKAAEYSFIQEDGKSFIFLKNGKGAVSSKWEIKDYSRGIMVLNLDYDSVTFIMHLRKIKS